MRLVIDTDARTVTAERGGAREEHPLDSAAAFDLITEHWVTVGWTQKYAYGFTWLGRPIIQLPEDMIRIQEVLHRVKPDVIVETGVAHGGSLIYYASLCKATDKGRVIGVDIEIRPHNRAAIEAHPLAGYITLIEGSSTAPETVAQVKGLIRPGERVLVLLDSNHSKAHVRAELDLYAELVSPGSYIVATDGIMGALAGRPGSQPGWEWDNPTEAAREFQAANPQFTLEENTFAFNEGKIARHVTYWPSAYLRRAA
ncbi:Rhamnosyl O-methyltransferase precursor [Gemmata obscuriglobus]|uniref:Hydroxylase n=1 Tax=Gemmata obscuriglobus TaxID=114 RepID=A0A2Z3GSV1_9BACT|nr:CmcI family methyltransferase [Gemmata obscuriglobus]AWM36348.1 hydroxylase [Gemmata obscuriglobus]QEG31040.1 Rhamnosyl O-methyltransferase precursor [Gemmata obscuriglobus]VTS10377.1 cephalosporin hydroxylase : Cephalosporin hydroxylase OS=Mariprofundus ferrooxydans PV-1 GN=SPV1_00300 PE=4 SV=1: CmcI [Gemmata obscuriglobus UQM 2246]